MGRGVQRKTVCSNLILLPVVLLMPLNREEGNNLEFLLMIQKERLNEVK